MKKYVQREIYMEKRLKMALVDIYYRKTSLYDSPVIHNSHTKSCSVTLITREMKMKIKRM